MKVVFHEDFRRCYSRDPAAAPGRIEAVEEALKGRVTFVAPLPAAEDDIAAVHTPEHMENVRGEGVYDIAALAAGGAILAAEIGMDEPCFALVRPPGHHASGGSSWGFCYFNNMAVALERLRRAGKIKSAFILDFDLHFGDGTVNILSPKGYATILNPSAADRQAYLEMVRKALAEASCDVFAVSAGFDNHQEDWGGLLATDDYLQMGLFVREASRRCEAGCFAILEGGYNHRVLGRNALAFLEGMGA